MQDDEQETFEYPDWVSFCTTPRVSLSDRKRSIEGQLISGFTNGLFCRGAPPPKGIVSFCGKQLGNGPW